MEEEAEDPETGLSMDHENLVLPVLADLHLPLLCLDLLLLDLDSPLLHLGYR